MAYSKFSTLESGFKKLRIRMPDSPDTCGRGLSRSDKKSILLECKNNIHLTRKYQLTTLFLRRLLDMGLPFYAVIRATRRSSGPMQGKGSTFISHWTRPLALSLCNQALYRLSELLVSIKTTATSTRAEKEQKVRGLFAWRRGIRLRGVTRLSI